MQIIEKHPIVLEDPAPSVLFMGFTENSIDFEIRCQLRDVNYLLTVRSDINFDIAESFRKEGIEIPFPRREIYFKEGRDAVEKRATVTLPEQDP